MSRSKRISLAYPLIRKSGFDALVVAPSPDLEYLTGLAPHPGERFNGLFLMADGRSFAVVSKLYAQEYREGLPTSAPVYEWRDEDWFFDTLSQAFADHDIGEGAVIGVNDSVMAVDAVEIAQRQKVSLANGWHTLGCLRLIKDSDEIACLKKAGEISDRALEALLPFIKPGRTEKEIRRKLLELMEDFGATSQAFTPIVARGENAAMPHYAGGEGVIKEKDSVLLDFGCRYRGYFSDMTRTFFIGERPEREIEEMYQVVLRSQDKGEAAARPGITSESLDVTARSVIEEAGYGQYFNTRLGHGIGLAIHESPNIMRGNPQTLAEGMTFSIEPGIYIPGKIGIRIENCVVVTTDGCEPLTRFPKELRVL
ncbi:MAG TPA: Xaa-Pro peptidase family protein [Synergistales bacterium]|nr:Xaa-Pro peptidase family protein [Synergistales bacterium]